MIIDTDFLKEIARRGIYTFISKILNIITKKEDQILKILISISQKNKSIQMELLESLLKKENTKLNSLRMKYNLLIL